MVWGVWTHVIVAADASPPQTIAVMANGLCTNLKIDYTFDLKGEKIPDPCKCLLLREGERDRRVCIDITMRSDAHPCTHTTHTTHTTHIHNTHTQGRLTIGTSHLPKERIKC